MGGGTGTGSSSVVAKIAKEVGALTVAVVTRPFAFEGAQRKDIADYGLNELKKEVDAYLIIPNDKLLQIVDPGTSAKNAFALSDEILRQAVEGVSDIITTPGEINTDFNDIKAVVEGAGPALMGIGIAEGDNRAKEAAISAVNSPLLDVSINGAKGILFVVAGSEDLGILEVQEAAKVIGETVDKNAKIIFGIMRDEKLKKGQLRIIVIATGFPESSVESPLPMSESRAERSSLFSMPKAEQEEVRGKIYNEVAKAKPEPVEEVKKEKVEPIVTAPSRKEEAPVVRREPVPQQEEEDGFGVIPSFLRRNKK